MSLHDFFTRTHRRIHDSVVPHTGNDHRPHMLRGLGALILAIIVLGAFAFSISRGLFFNRGSEFTAAVLPTVLVTLANEDRSERGLHNLTPNPVLEEAARLKAEHMAEHGYFAHVSPDGLDPWYWFYRAGYEFTDAGENLAVNFTDSDDVERAWMDSPGHRANILNNNFTEIGIAAVSGTYKGKKTVFVVQMFGTPAVAIPQSYTRSDTGTLIAVVPPAETLVREELSARVEGAAAAVEQAPEEPETLEEAVQAVEEAQIVQGESVSLLEVAAASPRATVSWIYIALSLLISFVLLLLVWKDVHRQHVRPFLYGFLLLVLILMVSYFNWLLLSSELLIV